MTIYEAQKLAEEKVKSFNQKEHKGCPCCGDDAIATWEPDEEDDPVYFIKCTNCSCQVTSCSWEECLDDWEGRRNSGDLTIKAYLETKKKLDMLKNVAFSLLRDICELCTCISSRERITDFGLDEDPVYEDEPEIWVDVTSDDYGDDTYYFPKRYLDMTLDEIKKDVEHMKKLKEEEEQRAETDAEYKQYLRLKEKFEKR